MLGTDSTLFYLEGRNIKMDGWDLFYARPLIAAMVIMR
jgi:hypothetical protein